MVAAGRTVAAEEVRHIAVVEEHRIGPVVVVDPRFATKVSLDSLNLSHLTLRADEHILAGLPLGMVVVADILAVVMARMLVALDMVIEEEADCIVAGHIEVAREVAGSRRIAVLEEVDRTQVQMVRRSLVVVKDTKV